MTNNMNDLKIDFLDGPSDSTPRSNSPCSIYFSPNDNKNRTRRSRATRFSNVSNVQGRNTESIDASLHARIEDRAQDPFALWKAPAPYARDREPESNGSGALMAVGQAMKEFEARLTPATADRRSVQVTVQAHLHGLGTARKSNRVAAVMSVGFRRIVQDQASGGSNSAPPQGDTFINRTSPNQ